MITINNYSASRERKYLIVHLSNDKQSITEKDFA